jgi:hypothetical protein
VAGGDGEAAVVDRGDDGLVLLDRIHAHSPTLRENIS